MKLTYRLRKEEFKKDYQLFMREAKEEKACDRHDAASSNVNPDYDSGSDGSVKYSERSRDHRRPRNRKERRTACFGDKIKDHKTLSDNSIKKSLPQCLNPACDGRHFMKECSNTSEAKKKELFEAYSARNANKYSAVNMGQVCSPQKEDNCSLFNATFRNGAVEVSVLADQGSDVNLMPLNVEHEHQELPDLIKEKDGTVVIEDLERSYYCSTVDEGGPALPCSRRLKALMLSVRHVTKLAMRELDWMVSDKPPVQNVLISRQVLQVIGLDNRKLLAASADRFHGIVNVPELLSKVGKVTKAKGGTVHSLLQNDSLEFGSTFHSQAGSEDNILDCSYVYVDIGGESAEELDTALAASVEQAFQNGMSREGAKKFEALLQKYRQMFE